MKSYINIVYHRICLWDTWAMLVKVAWVLFPLVLLYLYPPTLGQTEWPLSSLCEWEETVWLTNPFCLPVFVYLGLIVWHSLLLTRFLDLLMVPYLRYVLLLEQFGLVYLSRRMCSVCILPHCSQEPFDFLLHWIPFLECYVGTLFYSWKYWKDSVDLHLK